MPPTPPQAVVFDLGKVLVDFDYRLTVERIVRHCAAPPEQVAQTIDQSPLLCEYESGRLTTRLFFEAVRDRLGYQGSFEEFCNAFSDIFTPIPEIVELHARIRSAGIATFLLSNTNELAVRHISRTFPFFSEFDGHVFSHEAGVMKPDPAIYEAVEERAGLRGEALLFLDDRLENIEAGASRGWRTIHHRSPAETIDALPAHGLGAALG